MIGGAVVVAALLLLMGWWLRGASDQPTVASSPPETPAEAGEIVAAGVATPEIDPQDSSPQESPAQDDAVQGAVTPANEATSRAVEGSDEAEPPRGVREEPEKEEADEVQVASSEPEPIPPAPVTSPNPQPTPPAPVAIDAPLLAQGSNVEASPPPAAVQGWGGEVPDEPPVDNDAAAQEPRVPEAAVTAPPAAAAEPSIPTLKITSEQMKAAQRNYLARVIRFLEPPLEYEWIPKYTRPAFFASLVTDGEPPVCHIDFKEPTTITFDLVIRGGSGTESRIEDVEIIY
jgi:hypothetical protein